MHAVLSHYEFTIWVRMVLFSQPTAWRMRLRPTARNASGSCVSETRPHVTQTPPLLNYTFAVNDKFPASRPNRNSGSDEVAWHNRRTRPGPSTTPRFFYVPSSSSTIPTTRLSTRSLCWQFLHLLLRRHGRTRATTGQGQNPQCFQSPDEDTAWVYGSLMVSSDKVTITKDKNMVQSDPGRTLTPLVCGNIWRLKISDQLCVMLNQRTHSEYKPKI